MTGTGYSPDGDAGGESDYIHLSYVHVKICVQGDQFYSKIKSGLAEALMLMIKAGKESSKGRKILAFQVMFRVGESYVVILEENIKTK